MKNTPSSPGRDSPRGSPPSAGLRPPRGARRGGYAEARNGPGRDRLRPEGTGRVYGESGEARRTPEGSPSRTSTMALVAMFVALMVGSGWALAMVPNVEFVTALAFTAGAALGPVLGALTGAGGMFIFSATNPVGSGLAFPVLLAAQVVSQAAVGLLGGLFSRTDTAGLTRWPQRLLITIAGLAGTVLYDGLTSVSFPLFAGAPPSEIIVLLVSGLAFTAIHQVSNTLIFFLLVPRLVQVSRKYRKNPLSRGTLSRMDTPTGRDEPRP